MRQTSSIRALWAAIALAVCLVVPTAARAALPVTFDGLSDGTIVSNQFAGDGVVFVDQPYSTGLPVVRDVGARAASGTNVAVSTCFTCEFVHNVIEGQFAQTRATVSMHVGFEPADTPFGGKVRLSALDASRAVLGSVEATVSSTSVTTPMTIDPPGTDNIAFFRLETFEFDVVGASIAIDDLTFTGAGTAAPNLSVSSGSTDVRLLLGGTNLSAMESLFTVLARTQVSPALARPLLRENGTWVLMHLRAEYPGAHAAAHALLTQLRGRDLGASNAVWTSWLDGL